MLGEGAFPSRIRISICACGLLWASNDRAPSLQYQASQAQTLRFCLWLRHLSLVLCLSHKPSVTLNFSPLMLLSIDIVKIGNELERSWDKDTRQFYQEAAKALALATVSFCTGTELTQGSILQPLPHLSHPFNSIGTALMTKGHKIKVSFLHDKGQCCSESSYASILQPESLCMTSCTAAIGRWYWKGGGRSLKSTRTERKKTDLGNFNK